jgi:hypothetical protein
MKMHSLLLVALLTAAISGMLISCGAAASNSDPIRVTKDLFDAINRGQAEKAANLFYDDGELVTGFGQPTGLKKIHDFLKLTVIAMKTRVEIKEMKEDGTNVRGIFIMKNISTEYRNPTAMQVIAVVENGKIKSMTWSPQK